jgi:hypothetical protein
LKGWVGGLVSIFGKVKDDPILYASNHGRMHPGLLSKTFIKIAIALLFHRSRNPLLITSKPKLLLSNQKKTIKIEDEAKTGVKVQTSMCFAAPKAIQIGLNFF